MRYPPSLFLCLLFAAAYVPVALAAAPTVDELAAVLWRYNEQSPAELPIPSASQFEAIVAGKTITLRERSPIKDGSGESHDQIRVVGYQVVKRPRLLVWLATLNPRARHSDRLIEAQLDSDQSGSSLWYQHLDTPWPVRDRHWVIRNEKNLAIAEATRGLVWEHRWSLAERGRDIALNLMLDESIDGLDEDRFDSTIYLNVNRGAWTMFAVDDAHTLVAAHTTADIGGRIPDSWVARFVSRQLGNVLEQLAARADRVTQDYTGERVVFTGDGEPISPKRAAAIHEQYLRRKDPSASSAPAATDTS